MICTCSGFDSTAKTSVENFSPLLLQICDRLPNLKAIVQYSGQVQQKISNLYSVSPQDST